MVVEFVFGITPRSFDTGDVISGAFLDQCFALNTRETT